MNQPTPRRQITGLAPRTTEFNISALMPDRQRNTTTPTAPPSERHADPAPGAVDASPAATPHVRAEEPPTPAAAAASVNSAKSSVSVYLTRELRERARAAYRATSHLHDDPSWSAYVERAILELTEARERQHNDGQPYGADPHRLAPGRPLT